MAETDLLVKTFRIFLSLNFDGGGAKMLLGGLNPGQHYALAVALSPFRGYDPADGNLFYRLTSIIVSIRNQRYAGIRNRDEL